MEFMRILTVITITAVFPKGRLCNTIVDTSGIYWVPDLNDAHWKKVHHNDLVCPPLTPHPNAPNMNKTSVDISWPSTTNGHIWQEGNLCYGLSYSTICDTNFWGTQTRTQHISHHAVTELECSARIKDLESGDYTNPFFPEADCSWLRTNTKTSRFVSVQSHKVKFDPYSSLFIDGIFPNTKCTTRVCETVHENTIWVGKQEPSISCPAFTVTSGTLLMTEGTKGETWIQTGPNDYFDLKRSCQMTYCKVKGVRLSNGHFVGGVFGYPGVHKPCDANASITSDTYDSLEILEKRTIENFQLRFKCLELVQSYVNGGSVSYLGLSKFQPFVTGNHHVYRIRNKTLEYSIVPYYPLKSLRPLGDRQIGVLMNGTVWKLPTGVDSGDGTTYSIFNGVHTDVNGSLIVPETEMARMRYSETLMYLHTQVTIQHPAATQLAREGLTLADESLTTLVKDDPLTTIAKTWETWYGKMLVIGGLILVLIMLVFTLWCCWPCVLRCRAKKLDNNASPFPNQATVTYVPATEAVNW